MVERQLNWRRHRAGVAAVLTGGVLFWIALHCDGGDWFISQTHGDIIYTALSRFAEFPYFSFVFNGGSYFIQDPQSNLFSPVVPLILLAGPSVGLRLMEGIWGILGVLAFVAFMRQRVSLDAAIFGAVASVLGLGVLWKVAVGNDMFMWHLGLPAILWTAERVMKLRTVQSMLGFGLVLGLMLLGPTFHSFLYLFLPVVPLFVALEWSLNRATRARLGRTLVLFAGACVLAMLMVSPKLACWAVFPMSRPTADLGTLPILTGLQQTFDYSLAKDRVVETSLWLGTHKTYHGGWGVEESAIALPPIASLLALFGVVVGFRDPIKRRTAIFATVIIVCGLTLCCSAPVWDAFRALTGGNFRVASRFLGMTAFGLAIFAAFGADALLARLKNAARWASIGLFALLIMSALWWTKAAGSVPDESRMIGDDVNPGIIWPRAAYREERDAAAKIKGFTDVVRYRKRRDILAGIGYTDGFLVVGNDYDPTRWRAQSPQPIVVLGVKPEQVSVEHLRIKIRHMNPRSRIFLRAQQPAFGLAVVTDPRNAHVRVLEQGPFLVVENHSHFPVNHVVLRAEFPISTAWLVMSVLSLVGTSLALVVIEVARRRKAPALVSGALVASVHGG